MYNPGGGLAACGGVGTVRKQFFPRTYHVVTFLVLDSLLYHMVEVTIELRTHERAQLDEFVPRMVERLEAKGLDEEAEDLCAVDIIENLDETSPFHETARESAHDPTTYSAAPTEWATIIGALRVLREEEGLRSWWLRKKLARRLSRATDQLDPEEGASEDVTPRGRGSAPRGDSGPNRDDSDPRVDPEESDSQEATA